MNESTSDIYHMTECTRNVFPYVKVSSSLGSHFLLFLN